MIFKKELRKDKKKELKDQGAGKNPRYTLSFLLLSGFREQYHQIRRQILR
jgi:hypothetical protein